MSNYVLITGGSDGIGLELAKLFAKDKHNLVLAARNIERLNKAKEMLKCEGVDVRIISVDLSSMEECEKLINYIEDNNLSVDTLVNNAGIGSFGEFKDISWEKEEALIDINIKALSKLTKHFLAPSDFSIPAFAWKEVLTGPGQRQLTLMPSFLTSSCMASVKFKT